TSARGDKYAGEWPREAFGKHGVSYVTAEQSKSDCYVGFLPALNSGRVELLDCPRLAQQLGQLERRTSRIGKDSVDHPPGGHDDVANVVAGVLAPLVGGVADGLAWLHYLREGAAAQQAPADTGERVRDATAAGPPDQELERRRAAYDQQERRMREAG